MPDHIRVPISFERGARLNDIGYGVAPLPDGYGSIMSSWRPSPTNPGAVEPRTGWRNAAFTGAAATRRGRGMFLGYRKKGVRQPIVAAWEGGSHGGTGANLKIYAVPTATVNVDHPAEWSGALSLLETVTIGDSDWSLTNVVFTSGNGKLVYSNPGFATGRLHKWDGTTVSEIATDSIAGRAIAFHQNRFWTGGADATPSRLRYSEEADEDTWNVTTNFFRIKWGEGDPIECLMSWNGLLIVGKRSSMHYLYGTGPSSWGLREISPSIGCASGQYAMVTTPQGVVWVSQFGDTYLWNGGGEPRKLSEVVYADRGRAFSSSSGARTVPSRPASCAYHDGVVYVQPNRYTYYDVECYDLRRGISWVENEIGDALDQAERTFEMTCVDEYLVMAPEAGVVSNLLNWREPAYLGASRWSADPKPDVRGTHFEAFSGAVFPGTLDGKATLKNLWIRYRQFNNGAAGNGFTVTVWVDGVAQTPDVMGKNTQGSGITSVHYDRLGYSFTGRAFAFQFVSEPLDATKEDTYALDEIVADFVADPGPR